jgi:hypothetical protein
MSESITFPENRRDNSPQSEAFAENFQSFDACTHINNCIEGRNMFNSRMSNPPDPAIAVGKDHIVQMVNTGAQISKKGEPCCMWEFNGLSEFFGTGEDFISDPTLVYDKSADIFFASIVDVTEGSVHVVGFDPDDLQNRHIKVINFTACPDQTWLSVSADKVGLSTNLFEMGCPNNSYLGGMQVLFSKDDILREGTFQPLIDSGLIEDMRLFGARPAKPFAVSPDMLFVSVGDGSAANDILTLFRYAGPESMYSLLRLLFTSLMLIFRQTHSNLLVYRLILVPLDFSQRPCHQTTRIFG